MTESAPDAADTSQRELASSSGVPSIGPSVRFDVMKMVIQHWLEENHGAMGNWDRVYSMHGLNPDIGKWCRGVGGKKPSPEKLSPIYYSILESGYNSPPIPPQKSLYGFKSIKKIFDYNTRELTKYDGVYLGVSNSTLSQGRIALTLNYFESYHGGLRVVRSMFGEDRHSDEPDKKSSGHGYFIDKQIYTFTEDDLDPMEVMVGVFNQTPDNPVTHLLGVYIGRGATGPSPSHPAAAQMVLLRFKDVEPDGYVTMKAKSEKLNQLDPFLRKRWILPRELKSLKLPEHVGNHLIGNHGCEGEDFALRIRAAYVTDSQGL